MQEKKVACFTGHRKLPQGVLLEQIKMALESTILEAIGKGYETFIFGGAVGWDMLCGAMVIQLQKEYPHIQLIGAIPFLDQELERKDEEQKEYRAILSMCHDMIVLCEYEQKNCYEKRNQYMVDCSDLVIAYWDGRKRSGTGQTIRMAGQKKSNIVNLYEKQ